MADRIWQRLRRESREGRRAARADEEPVSLFEGREDVLESLQRDPGVPPTPGDDAGPDQREAAYADWAERMRVKREERQRRIRGPEGDGDADGTDGAPGYWTTDFLFAESRRLEDEHGGALETRADLLRILELPPDATGSVIQRQYRRLAKRHHPDRFPDADEATREAHAEQMHRISSAYRALQDQS